MPAIFISYAREDQEAAQSLADDLGALGQDPWLDQALTGGQAWWNEILAAIRRSDVMAFAISARSLESVACKRELGYAVSLRKPILPVLVGDGVVVELLPPALAEMQFVDYRSADREALRALARSVANLPAPRPLPEPLPPEPGTPISYLGSIAEEVETSDALSFEEQSSIVLRLKGSLRGSDAAPARTLLAKLRTRGDLYARIADEIDSLLERSAPAMRAARPAPGTDPAPKPLNASVDPPPKPLNVAVDPPSPPPSPVARPAAQADAALSAAAGARVRQNAEGAGRAQGAQARRIPTVRSIVIVVLSVVLGVGAANVPMDMPDTLLRLTSLAPAAGIAVLLFGVYWERSRRRPPLLRVLAILLASFAALVCGVGASQEFGFSGVPLGYLMGMTVAGVLAWQGQRLTAVRAVVVAVAIVALGVAAANLDWYRWSLVWFEIRGVFMAAWVLGAAGVLRRPAEGA